MWWDPLYHPAAQMLLIEGQAQLGVLERLPAACRRALCLHSCPGTPQIPVLLLSERQKGAMTISCCRKCVNCDLLTCSFPKCLYITWKNGWVSGKNNLVLPAGSKGVPVLGCAVSLKSITYWLIHLQNLSVFAMSKTKPQQEDTKQCDRGFLRSELRTGPGCCNRGRKPAVTLGGRQTDVCLGALWYRRRFPPISETSRGYLSPAPLLVVPQLCEGVLP